MKKITTLFALFVGLAVFAQQHRVGSKVAEFKSAGATFHHFSVLTATNGPADDAVQRAVTKSTLAQINLASVNSIVANKYQTIELEIPYLGNNILVELYQSNPFNQNFHLDTDKAKNVAYERGVYYRGIVKGDLGSVVSFNFFNNEINGIISADGIGNVVVGKLDKSANTSDYIVYSDADLRIMSGFNCSMKDDSSSHDHDQDTEGRQMLTERCVTMYFEIDHDIYQQNNSSVTLTTNWMTAVFNNVQTLYENDGITVSLKSMYIWTEFDPYEGIGESSGDYLFAFNANRPVFDGDVGQLLGIDPGGLGGVAVTIDGLCTQNNFSYSDVNFSYSSVPTFSWTVQVITHEMGHLLGSRHTHACVWNGNGTSIDGCGTQAGYTEGSCAMGPIPSPSEKGTIMSYCHLISGIGIDFNNGFGPQPADAIYNAVEGSPCLSTDCINTCINTITDITITNPTTTSAFITWNDPSGATSWQVSVTLFTSSADNWVTVNTNSFTTTAPLSPNTYYKVKVRPVCENATPMSRQNLFATPGVWCNGVVITDTGGVTGNYTDNQHYFRVLIPNLPQKAIRMNFTHFDLELDFDYLTVYSGIGPDIMLGQFTGTEITSPIESITADGALTLEFMSDPGVVESGYVANVSCIQNLGVNETGSVIDFTYYPNPTNGTVNIESNTDIEDIKVYNVQGQLLYQSKANGVNKRIDVSAFSTGTYFFKLDFAGGKQANFKIVKN
jgi:hypothetical protein